MTGILWRVLIAVIAALLAYALIPPVAHLLGFTIGPDLWIIIRVCVAGLAIYYILRGPAPPFRVP